MHSLISEINFVLACVCDKNSLVKALRRICIKYECTDMPSKEHLQVCNVCKKGYQMSHKKIMKKAAKALDKDAKHYAKEAKHEKSPAKKKHELLERAEAKSAAKDLKKRAKKAHE